jgi:hypothetical protein
MRKDSYFSVGKFFIHWIHYLPGPKREPWKLGWVIGKNVSGLFGRGITIDFYIGQQVYVLILSKDD